MLSKLSKALQSVGLAPAKAAFDGDILPLNPTSLAMGERIMRSFSDDPPAASKYGKSAAVAAAAAVFQTDDPGVDHEMPVRAIDRRKQNDLEKLVAKEKLKLTQAHAGQPPVETNASNLKAMGGFFDAAGKATAAQEQDSNEEDDDGKPDLSSDQSSDSDLSGAEDDRDTDENQEDEEPVRGGLSDSDKECPAPAKTTGTAVSLKQETPLSSPDADVLVGSDDDLDVIGTEPVDPTYTHAINLMNLIRTFLETSDSSDTGRKKFAAKMIEAVDGLTGLAIEKFLISEEEDERDRVAHDLAKKVLRKASESRPEAVGFIHAMLGMSLPGEPDESPDEPDDHDDDVRPLPTTAEKPQQRPVSASSEEQVERPITAQAGAEARPQPVIENGANARLTDPAPIAMIGDAVAANPFQSHAPISEHEPAPSAPPAEALSSPIGDGAEAPAIDDAEPLGERPTPWEFRLLEPDTYDGPPPVSALGPAYVRLFAESLDSFDASEAEAVRILRELAGFLGVHAETEAVVLAWFDALDDAVQPPDTRSRRRMTLRLAFHREALALAVEAWKVAVDDGFAGYHDDASHQRAVAALAAYRGIVEVAPVLSPADIEKSRAAVEQLGRMTDKARLKRGGAMVLVNAQFSPGHAALLDDALFCWEQIPRWFGHLQASSLMQRIPQEAHPLYPAYVAIQSAGAHYLDQAERLIEGGQWQRHVFDLVLESDRAQSREGYTRLLDSRQAIEAAALAQANAAVERDALKRTVADLQSGHERLSLEVGELRASVQAAKRERSITTAVDQFAESFIHGEGSVAHDLAAHEAVFDRVNHPIVRLKVTVKGATYLIGFVDGHETDAELIDGHIMSNPQTCQSLDLGGLLLAASRQLELNYEQCAIRIIVVHGKVRNGMKVLFAYDSLADYGQSIFAESPVDNSIQQAVTTRITNMSTR